MAEWERKSKYHETNGTHNVAAVKVLRMEDVNEPTRVERGREIHQPMGGTPVWMFEAWRVSCKPRIWLGLFEKADEARAACERDAA